MLRIDHSRSITSIVGDAHSIRHMGENALADTAGQCNDGAIPDISRLRHMPT